MFADKIEPIISNEVATIYGKEIIPKCVVIVNWYWIYEEGKTNTKKLNDVL